MYLEVDSSRIFFEHQGPADRTLVLVNGHTRTSSDFRSMGKYLRELGFGVLVFDNRGSGQTRDADPHFSRDHMVSDIFSLTDHLGCKNFGLLGISMGGMIAQIAAAKRPDVINGLCLVSTTCSRKYMKALPQWGLDFDSIKSRLSYYVSNEFFLRNEALVNAMAKQMLKPSPSGEEMNLRSEAQTKAMLDYDTKEYLGQIKASTLIIHGDKDRVIDLEAAKELDRQIQNSELKCYEGVGHLILAEHPKVFFSDVGDFFARQF